MNDRAKLARRTRSPNEDTIGLRSNELDTLPFLLAIFSSGPTEDLSFPLFGEDGEGEAEEREGEVVEFWLGRCRTRNEGRRMKVSKGSRGW